MSNFTEPFSTPPRLQAATLAGRFMQPQSMSNAPNITSGVSLAYDSLDLTTFYYHVSLAHDSLDLTAFYYHVRSQFGS